MTVRLDAVVQICDLLDADERGKLAAFLTATVDARGLALIPVAYFSRLTEIAKRDPFEAGRLASAMYQHLAAHRPESPAPLDSGFEPTEAERDPRTVTP